MRRVILSATIGLVSSIAAAQTSQTTAPPPVAQGTLGGEIASVTPEIGTLEFTDPTGGASGRFAAGVTFDNDFVAILKIPSPFSYGLSTGVIFAHIGDPSANLFGSNASASLGLSAANALLIPVNLKFGYGVTDRARLSFHAGGNIFYRSVASAMNLGSSSDTASPSWDIFPNLGLDLELGVVRGIALDVRPDWTITPGASVFLGTIGISFFLS